MQSDLERQFDLKSLLLLRRHLADYLAQDLQVASVSWNAQYIRQLCHRIYEKTSVKLSERTLNMVVSESVTDETKIPHLSTRESRVDLPSRYMGYQDFKEFQDHHHSKIDELELAITTEPYHKRNEDKFLERRVYYLRMNEPGTGREDSREPLVTVPTQFALVYYYTPYNIVFRGLVKMFPTTGALEIHLPNEPPFPEDKIVYTGQYQWDSLGYLSTQTKLLDTPSYGLWALFFAHKSYQSYKWILGTYIATSLTHFGCWSGIAMLERIDTYEDAQKRWKEPLDERIDQFLRGTLLATPHEAYYSLDELLRVQIPSNGKLAAGNS